MTVRKAIGLILITVCLLIMLHSIVSLYIGQCLRSTVAIPSFFTEEMIEFFQIDNSNYGKGLRMVLILILPTLGIELFRNKISFFLSGSLILRTIGVLIGVAILCYILFYPFFE